MLMSDVWNDPFCRPADVLIKSLSLNGDIWLTWLGSVLAAPMSAGTGDGYIRADSESSRQSHAFICGTYIIVQSLAGFFGGN